MSKTGSLSRSVLERYERKTDSVVDRVAGMPVSLLVKVV